MHRLAPRAMQRRMVHIERRITELGYVLPAPAVPKGNFVNYRRVGKLVYLSGHLPQRPTEAGFVTGKVGAGVSVEEGRIAALYCALNLCATLQVRHYLATDNTYTYNIYIYIDMYMTSLHTDPI